MTEEAFLRQCCSVLTLTRMLSVCVCVGVCVDKVGVCVASLAIVRFGRLQSHRRLAFLGCCLRKSVNEKVKISFPNKTGLELTIRNKAAVECGTVEGWCKKAPGAGLPTDQGHWSIPSGGSDAMHVAVPTKSKRLSCYC